jgi:S-adenosylmethionine-diacylglycerol 3-amino-3-carboxypropyl transferase
MNSNIKEQKRLEKVNFDIIRYANCWEDADLLLEELNLPSKSNILSIASGGDNSFSLLTTGAKQVVAVDISETQLLLVELKVEAIKQMDRVSYMQFIGFLELSKEKRVQKYNALKPNLSAKCIEYWDTSIAVLEDGIVHQGKFEKYFQIFAKKVLPFIHSQKKIDKLLAPKSAEDQLDFFNKKWNTWRWRTFFKAFFSRFVMGRLGRDKAFLKEVKGSVSEFILNQAQGHLSTVNAQNNFMLNYALTGSFRDALPHYVREGNYEIVKVNINNLKLVKGLAQDAIKEHGPFDGFNLSNIFEYLDLDTFKELQKNLIDGGTKNAKYAYWNLMVDRFMSDNKELALTNQTQKFNTKDKGFFYKRLVVDAK